MGDNTAMEEKSVKDSGTKDANVSFKLDREDHLTLMLLSERSRRIEQEQSRLNSEKALLQSENREFVRIFQSKYKAEMNNYVVDLESGTVSLKSSQNS